MNRIAYMVLRNFFRAPIWFYHIWKLGRSGDTHTEQQRYDYIRNVVKTVNRTGRVEVEVHGIQNLPEKNGFILFPNHQGLFDVLAIMESCPNPLGIVVKKEASNIILIIHARHGHRPTGRKSILKGHHKDDGGCEAGKKLRDIRRGDPEQGRKSSSFF